MAIRNEEKEQLKKLFLFFVIGVIVVVTIIVYALKNSDNATTNDANLIKEHQTSSINNETENEGEKAEIDNTAEQENENKTENDITQISKDDPFYKQIYAQINKQKKLGFMNTKFNYYPGDNYIENAANSKGEIHIFKKNPIMIYVPKGEYYDSVTQAFVAYNNNFKGLLSFKATDDPKKSDIEIILTDNLSEFNDGERLLGVGSIKKYDAEGNILHSQLALLNNSTSQLAKPTKILMYNIALHEIGHCIGISGHSQDENDIMYKQEKAGSLTELKSFSNRDTETIKLMYSGRNDLIAKALENVKSSKLNENIKYAQEANSSDSYLKVADSYYNVGQYDKALDSYKKALQLNPDNYRIYLALSNCYSKSRQYDNSLTFAKYALDRAKTEEQRANANIMIAQLYTNNKDYAQASSYYRTALIQKANDENVFIAYLINCYRNNDKKSAKEVYDKYINNFSENAFDENAQEIIKWAKS